MAHKPIKYSEKDILEVLKVYCSRASVTQYAINNNISPSIIGKWTADFANGRLILNESLFTKKNLEDLGVSSLEEFKKKFMKAYESNLAKGKNITDDIKFNILKDYFNVVPLKKIAEKYNIGKSSIYKYKDNFINGILIFEESKLNGITKAEIDKLKSQAKAMLDSGQKIIRPDKYDDSVKLKIIKEYCGVDGNGEKNANEIARNNRMSKNTFVPWIKGFVDGTLVFDEKQFKITKDEIEDLKIKAAKINRNHSDDFKLTVLEEYLLEGMTALNIQDKHGLHTATLHAWYKNLCSNKLLNKNRLNDSQKARLKILKKQAILREENKKIKDKYTNDFKNTIVKELLNGKTGPEIETIYKVSANTSSSWKCRVIKNGPYGADNLSEEEKEEFERLIQEEFKKREIDKLKEDGDFTWITYYDEDLKYWAEFANEFMKSLDRNISSYQSALKMFFDKFVIPIENNVSRDVGIFLNRNRNYNSPNFVEVCWGSISDKSHANCIIKFIEWILDNKCSDEDDYGNKHILEGFYNPLEKDIPPGIASSSRLSESNKNVLPYRFIRDLRTTLCPLDAVSFADWTWVQQNHNASWFVVSEKFIDDVLKDFEKNGQDPDFVYRKRKYGRTKKTVYEVWSPVAAVALFLKLTLPLRTYQVRMLDSGEADTEMYVQKDKTKPGEWVKNDCKLSNPNVKYPVTNGILRKFKNHDFDIENAFEDSQLLSRKEMTGFFINTNKTADINKPANKKGYNIPWEHKELQYWIAKLRDWQKKYNPLDEPTAWTELDKKHLNNVKSEKELKQMGTSTFLFRNPAAEGEEQLPLTDGVLNGLWYKLLEKLEKDFNKSLSEENYIKFVKEDSRTTTYYSLHCLRVSLITAYATDGGVPIEILSKMVAGHTSLIMTLYYVKPSIAYSTDLLDRASESIRKADMKNMEQFLKTAKYEDLKSVIATNDIVGYDALIHARETGCATILVGDKGICPKGNAGCDSGSTITDEQTGKTKSCPVPGYPAERNCVRCKWFITGPAFLPGLVHHFNVIGCRLSEVSKKMTKLQHEVEEVENYKYQCELNGKVFTESQMSKMITQQKLYEDEVQKCDKLANDYNATLRLIDKCMILSKESSLKKDSNEQNLQLVANSSQEELKLSFRESESEFEQLQIICNGAEIFTETDVSKEVLKRSQIYNRAFMNYCNAPLMLYLTEEQQHIVGNQIMMILMNKIKLNHKQMSKQECFKKAVSYIEGRKTLEAQKIMTDTMKDFYKTAQIMKLEEVTHVIEQSGLLEQNNALEQDNTADFNDIIEIQF